jgi:hypothetical protein
MPEAPQMLHRNEDGPVVIFATAYQKDFGDFERELLFFCVIEVKLKFESLNPSTIESNLSLQTMVESYFRTIVPLE